jgi:hypothetical protein
MVEVEGQDYEKHSHSGPLKMTYRTYIQSWRQYLCLCLHILGLVHTGMREATKPMRQEGDVVKGFPKCEQRIHSSIATIGSAHTRTLRSVFIDADAIMFSDGCVATETTTSASQGQYPLLLNLIQRKINLPLCASSICTTSRLCRSHTYTFLSSLPPTIHFPPVTLNAAEMQ